MRDKIMDFLNTDFLESEEIPEDNDMRVEDGETEKCVFKFVL